VDPRRRRGARLRVPQRRRDLADLSANLPDAPVNDLVVWRGKLVVGTDVGVFSTSATAPGTWSQTGQGLPNASTNDLTISPDGSYLLAATHGRGLWKIS